MQAIACSVCGKIKNYAPSSIAKGQGKFCSRACQHAAKTCELTCAGCGKPFTRKKSWARRYEHPCCSRACKHLFLSRAYLGEGSPSWHGGKTLVGCAHCGKTISREVNQLKRGRPFCNRHCKGAWIAEHRTGVNSPRYKGGYQSYYGPNWLAQRRAARKRDHYRCQHCGVSEKRLGRELDVHHLQPFRTFGYIPGKNDRYLQANELTNLITLCPSCHAKAEHGYVLIQPYLL